MQSMNKSPGLYGISGEHLKNASHILVDLLSVLITRLFIHGIVPHGILYSVIIPVIIDNKKVAIDIIASLFI